MIMCFRDIVALWPKPSADTLAAEIGAGVTATRKWSQRNSIPAEWWTAIAASPLAQAAGVTVELMAGLVAKPPADDVSHETAAPVS